VLRAWAVPEAVSPFSNPDPFSQVKQFTAEEQKELDEGIAFVRQHRRDAATTFLWAHTKSNPERWWLAGVLSSLLFTEGNYQEAYNYANAAVTRETRSAARKKLFVGRRS
jgi:hypothetical protein